MVRIILRSGRNRGAIVSVMVAVAAGVSSWVAYWMWHRDDPPRPPPQDFTSEMVQWRCPEGHVFPAKAAYEPVPCPTCRNPAHILIPYDCPQKHGPFRALVMFDSRTRRLSHVRFDGQEWVPVGSTIACPVCGRDLHPPRRTLFSRTPSDDRKPGGAEPPKHP